MYKESDRIKNLILPEGTINNHHYKNAGVDVAAASALIESIKPLAATTRRPGCIGGLGGFGAVFDPKAAGYDDPLLVAATDGVGTKVKIAIESNQHDTVGIDLVAMCVNDLVTLGAEPLFFLDYIACEQLRGERENSLVAGIAKGCRQAGCALIGGETAEMPGLYRKGDYDLAGFSLGAVERGQLLDGSTIQPGDVVLGLASNGIHANGFSLIRQVIDDDALDLAKPARFDREKRALGDVLLTPTRIYAASCLAALRQTPPGSIRGFAHITGGGLIDNIPRIIPDGMAVRLDANAWPLPEIFAWLCGHQGIAPQEMVGTFNCGLGMVALVDPKRQSLVADILSSCGETVFAVGVVEQAPEKTPDPIIIDHLDLWP